MTIFIKTLTGKTITLDINPSFGVLFLRELIQGKEGIPPDKQRLIFNGRQLENCKASSYHNIQHGSTIYLMFRLNGAVCFNKYENIPGVEVLAELDSSVKRIFLQSSQASDPRHGDYSSQEQCRRVCAPSTFIILAW